MIAELTGTVSSLRKGYLVLDVSGVGYKVYMTEGALLLQNVGSHLHVHVHSAIRETAFDLFGFTDFRELSLFELLLDVPGIGPRSALGILNLADVGTLESAIASGNASYLTKVSGIGKKSAEKIVITLSEKMGTYDGKGLDEETEALEALRALGYSPKEAREALQNVSRDVSGTSERIREALKLLGR